MSVLDRISALPAMSASRAWFGQRSAREQLLLIGLGALAMGAFLLMLVWSPLAAQRDAALSQIEQYDTLLARVHAAGPELKRSTPTSGAEATSVADSAATHGLLIRRIEPDGELTRIAFEDAHFLQLIDWIASIQADGLARVTAIQMDRRPAPGTVNAQVTVEE